MSEIVLTDSNFQQEVLESKIPVLVDFWAPWCGPCHMVAPIVGEIAQTYATRLKVGKLNVDENPMIARQYGIRGIPTLMIFKDGKLADTVVGAVPKQALEQALEPHLAKS